MNKDRKIDSSNRIFIASTVLVLLCFFILYFTCGIFFRTNEDVGMMKVYSGYSTGIPSPYHQYGSFTYGLMFKVLYTAAPNVNWFTLVSISIVVSSVSIIIWSIAGRVDMKKLAPHSVVIFMAITIMVIAFSLYGLVGLTYTITSTLASVAGMMLYLGIYNTEKLYWKIFIATLMVFIGSLVRNASFKGVVPFIILAGLYVVIRNKLSTKKESVKLLILMLLPIILILVYGRIDSYFKTYGFKTAEGSFEYYRSLYTDHPHIPFEGNEDFYESIGWDEEFFTMTKSWMFIDPRFNADNLKLIAEKSAEFDLDSGLTESLSSIWDGFVADTLKNQLRLFLLGIILVFFAVGLICFVGGMVKRKSDVGWLFLFLSQSIGIAEVLYLIFIKKRLVDKTFMCVAIPCLYIGMWVVVGQIFKRKGVMKELVILCVSLIAIFVSVKQNISWDQTQKVLRYSEVAHDADTIYYENPDCLYIYDTTIIRSNDITLDMNLKGCGNNALMWGGTGVFSTTFYEKISRFGYSEFYSYNLFDDNVYFITTSSDIESTNFMRYMRKQYGENVTAERVIYKPSGVSVYKFSI